MSHDDDDLPANNTTAGVLQLNVPFEGQWEPHPNFTGEYDTDIDWYRVELGVGSYLLELLPSPLDSYDADFEAQPSEAFEESSDWGTSLVSTLRSGEFFVSVGHVFAAVTGKYTIRVSDYEVPADTSTQITKRITKSKFNHVETAGDQDFFRVELNEGWIYQFDLHGASSGANLADPFLRISDEDGNLLIDDDNSGSGSDSRITFTAPKTGAFYVSSGGVGNSTGFYRLASSYIDYQDDAAVGSATTARLNFNANQAKAFAGQIEVEGDIDWFKVDLVANRWYQFGITTVAENLSGSDRERGLLLRDPDNEVRAVARGETASVFYQATKTGTHHLVARDGLADYVVWAVDNFAPAISVKTDYKLLTETESVGFRDLFRVEDFPVAKVQIYSEVEFSSNTAEFEKFVAHVVPENELDQLRFNGNGDISIRAFGGGTHTGWVQSNVRTEPGPYRFLNIDKQWDETNTQNESNSTITYRFADTAPSYFEDGRFANVSPVSQTVKNIIKRTVRDLGLNVSFVADSSDAADIQIFTADTSELSVGYAPGKFGFGDIVLDNEFYSGDAAPKAGSKEYFSILKALGTSLGIKHFSTELTPSESIAGLASDELIPSDLFPETFGYFDMAFLRSKYGASSEGGNSWKLGDETQPFARGINHLGDYGFITATNADRPAMIDLREGSTSYLLGDGPWQSYTAGKGSFQGRGTAVGSVYDDTLTGNHRYNIIRGLAGNDVINGLGGNDELHGGEGDDIYLYESGDGFDTIRENFFDNEAVGGTDTIRITGKWNMDRIEDDLTFQALGDNLVINLDMNGEYNRSAGQITIQGMSDPAKRIERLDLRSFSGALGVYSLESVWNAATFEKLRFAPTGQSDAFGIIVSPV